MKNLILSITCLFCVNALAQGELWGVTSSGGEYGAGTIYKTNADGTGHNVQYSFTLVNPGARPIQTQMVEINGKFYGMTKEGGKKNNGVIFKYDPLNNDYTLLYEFPEYSPGQSNIGYPTGGFCLAENGKLFGTTVWGGVDGGGAIFELDPSTDAFSIRKSDFKFGTGKSLYGGLVKASNGKMYGLTTKGGASDLGVLYEFDPITNSYVKKIAFNGLNGAPHKFQIVPEGGAMLEASNGKLYGITGQGGSSDKGTVFEYDPGNNTLIQKHSFRGIDGAYPKGGLVEVSNETLYGLTVEGGLENKGVLFELNLINGEFKKLYDFTEESGFWPNGSLVLAGNGHLYGVTAMGGIPLPGGSSTGSLFEFDPLSKQFKKIIDFNNRFYGGSPQNSLMLASDGLLYGMTTFGGSNDGGVIFSFNPNTNQFLKKIDFSRSEIGNKPRADLISFNSKLYGLAGQWIYEFDPTVKSYLPKVKFDGTNGSAPSSLTLLSNGKFYGAAFSGGIIGQGTLFEYEPITNTLSKKIDFGSTENGALPTGNLLVTSNEKIYGATWYGGTYNSGVIFEFDPNTDAFSKRYDFTEDQAYYSKWMTEALDGKIYGISADLVDKGAIFFQFEPTNGAFTKLFEFPVASGKIPISPLLEISNGEFLGVTYANSGSTNGPFGTLYQFNSATGSVSKKIEFDNSLGAPWGKLLKAPNGKIYGTTSDSKSVLYEYDPSLNSIQALHHFDGLYADPHGVIYQDGTHLNNQFIPLEIIPKKHVGELPFTLPEFTSAGLPIVYESSDPSVATIDGNTVTIVGIGQTVITGSQPGNETTLPAPNISRTLYVGKAILLLKVENKVKNYGDLNPSFSFSYSGFLNGDDATLFQQSPSIYCEAGQFSDAGYYSITFSQATLSPEAASKYDVWFSNGILTVNKLNLFVTADNKTATYGSSIPALTLSYSGFVGNDGPSHIDKVPKISTEAMPLSNVGTYPITLFGGSDNNYQLILVNGEISINKALLTISAIGCNRIYGQEDFSSTLTYIGFQGVDHPGVIDALPLISTPATQFSNVGVYPVTLSGGTDNNYLFVLTNGKLTINKATLAIQPNDQVKQYGSVNPTFNLIYEGFLGIDDATMIDVPPTVSTPASQFSNVGVYPIAIEGGIDNNYLLTLITGSLTIDKAPLKIKANDQTRLYGSPNQDFSYSYEGFVGSDNEDNVDVLPSTSTSATQFSNVGAYPILLTAGLDNNYSLISVDGVLYVEKAILTITATDQKRPYGESNPQLDFFYAGFVGTDNRNVIDTEPAIETIATEISNPGIFPITLTGGADNNYLFNLVNGSLTITKASQTISFISLTDASIDGAPFELTATSTSGLPVTFTTETGRTSISNGVVTMVSAGRETIAAKQEGNNFYDPAPPVTNSFCINPTKPQVATSFDDPTLPILTSSAAAGNQWFVNGNLIDGEVRSSVEVTEPGVYTLRIEVDDCKSEFSDPVSLVITGDLNLEDRVAVYPNPSNSLVYLVGFKTEAKECVVSDALGRQTTLAVQENDNQRFIDIQNLPPGLYILHVVGGKPVHLFRLIRK